MTTRIVRSLFDDNLHVCAECHRALPKSYSEEICPACKERDLFSRVKDYIRSNDVTEYDVAEHFEIPLSKVKSWIREGRIQYKDKDIRTLVYLFCQRCGEPISFGTLCAKCQGKANLKGRGLSNPEEDDRFRYL